MIPRALAIDLDGTLLNKYEEVSPRNLEAIQAAKDAGIEIIIATARWYQLAQNVGRVIGVQGPAIACSGAEVRRLSDGTDLFDVRLPAAFADDFYEICDSNRCIAWVALDDTVLVKLDGPTPDGMPAEARHVPKLKGAADVAPRIAMVQGTSAVRLVEEALAPVWGEQVRFIESISSNLKSILTLTATGADKGVALGVACADLGFEPKDVVAIGDAGNDIEMFRVAGASFAMGQAKDAVKLAATHVTAPNDEDGVAEAIESVLAGRLFE